MFGKKKILQRSRLCLFSDDDKRKIYYLPKAIGMDAAIISIIA